MTPEDFDKLVRAEYARRGCLGDPNTWVTMHIVLREIAKVESRLKYHDAFPGANEVFAQIRSALGLPEDL